MGAWPAELAGIAQPAQFDTATNLKTVSNFGIAISASLTARADEAIEQCSPRQLMAHFDRRADSV